MEFIWFTLALMVGDIIGIKIHYYCEQQRLIKQINEIADKIDKGCKSTRES